MRGRDTHAVLRTMEHAQTGSVLAAGRGRGGVRRRQTTIPGGAEIRDAGRERESKVNKYKSR